MKMRHVFLAACMAGLLALPAGAAQNENPPKADSSQLRHHWADLGLNQNQKDQMKAVREENREKMKTDFEATKALRQKIKEEFLKANPDPAALDSYADQMSQLHKQMIKNRFAGIFKTKQILTPEQFTKFMDMRQHRGKGDHNKKWNHDD
jgi:Spy/CpxP family protein refolding chaperone